MRELAKDFVEVMHGLGIVCWYALLPDQIAPSGQLQGNQKEVVGFIDGTKENAGGDLPRRSFYLERKRRFELPTPSLAII